jgi:Uma2 family endonuclease
MVTHRAADELPPRRPLKRSEYDILVAQGVFEGERVELVNGELIAMSPQGAPHRYYGAWLLNRLSELLRGRARIQANAPILAADESEPEPDVSVYPIEEERRDRLPERFYLVIEVSESSRRFDLGVKARLYAKSQIPAYWCVDALRRAVIVHEEPSDGEYRRIATAVPGTGAKLLIPHFADVAIDVDQLFAD